MDKLLLLKKGCISICALLLLISYDCIAQTDSPIAEIFVGPNYVIWEAEATKSPLGYWQIVTEEDEERFFTTDAKPAPSRGTHLEFTGNNPSSGPATSPLEYTFVCPKTASYQLAARLHQRLEGEEPDKSNDVFIKMKGNFTSGNPELTDKNLTSNTKFLGRGRTWGAMRNLEVGHVRTPPIYNMIEGEEYTLTMSGRAQNANVDYFLLFDTSLGITLEFGEDLAEKSALRPPEFTCKDLDGIDTNYTGISGFNDADTDNISGLDVLKISDASAWAAAQYVYEGTPGDVKFNLNTIQDVAGESTYRVKINDVLVGEVTNDRIHGTTTPNHSTQSHEINAIAVPIKDGDIIQVEFNNTSNGLVSGEAAEGMWSSLNICTTGAFTFHRIEINEDSVQFRPWESFQVGSHAVIPKAIDQNIIWETQDSGVVTVTNDGTIIGVANGDTKVSARSADGALIDFVDVSIKTPTPFSGTPSLITDKIEAEDYDLGGSNIAYSDTGVKNSGKQYRKNDEVDIIVSNEGGFALTNMEKDEWLEYTVNVEQEGVYSLEARVSALDRNGRFYFELDGERVTENIQFSPTGDIQNWTTLTIGDITLKAGVNLLTLHAELKKWNMDWFQFTFESSLSVDENILQNKAFIYPNPAENEFTIKKSNNFNVDEVAIRNIAGQVVYQQQIKTFGDITIPLENRNYGEGLYFVELIGENISQTIKLILK